MSLKRVATLTLAFFGACLLAGSVFALAFELWMPSPTLAESLSSGLFFTAFYTFLVALFALIPALIGIVIAERFGIDAPQWYALAGAVAGVGGLLVVVLVFGSGGQGGPGTLDYPDLSLSWLADIAIIVLAGACAGLVFWLIAVRLPTRTGILWPRLRPQA
jgi:hypothetical protein